MLKIRNFASVKKPFQIFTILLAVLIFVSPMLVFASVLAVDDHQAEMEMSCCTTDDSERSDHDCCHSGQPLDDHKTCDDNGCPTHDCFLHHVTVFHVYSPETSFENETKPVSLEKLKSDIYSSLIIKDLGFSLWNPPKYIS